MTSVETPGLEFGRFRWLFPGFALVARGSSRSDVLKVAVWLQPTGGAPRISVASRSDACYTQRVHATMADTFTSLHYHVVLSTKGREPWLRLDMQEDRQGKPGL